MNHPYKSLKSSPYKKLFILVKPNLGSILIIILLSTIVSVSSVIIALASKNMIDRAIHGSLWYTGISTLIFILLILMQIATKSILTLLTAKTSKKMSFRLQENYLRTFYSTEWYHITKYKTGNLLSLLSDDIETIVNACINLLPTIISLIIQLLTAFIALFYLDKVLSTFALVLAPLTALFSFLVANKFKNIQHKIRKNDGSYLSYINEIIQNLIIIKTFGSEDTTLDKIDDYQQNKLSLNKDKNRIAFNSFFILDTGYNVGYFIALGWGVFQLSGGIISLGTFTAFLQLFAQAQRPIEDLAFSIPDVASTMASVERLMELESLGSEEVKSDELITNLSDISLCMDQVTFFYNPDTALIKNVALLISPCETVALLGTSGEGKTTLIRLLLALLKPNHGSIYFSNKETRIEISPSTRAYFSYVPQGYTLFSGSIIENLRVGAPNSSEEELIEALTVANAIDFVNSLENGINTVVGENGVGLSEGQSQRIAIARAILRRSPVLILDEATSSLDIDTERVVLNNIKKQNQSRMCIVITHRTSAIDICDRVLRLSDGILIENVIDRTVI